VTDDINGCIAGVDDNAPQNRVDRMGSELEGGDNAGVPSSAPQGPKEVLVFNRIGGEYSAVSAD
jgi:hypothetical protein